MTHHHHAPTLHHQGAALHSARPAVIRHHSYLTFTQDRVIADGRYRGGPYVGIDGPPMHALITVYVPATGRQVTAPLRERGTHHPDVSRGVFGYLSRGNFVRGKFPCVWWVSGRRTPAHGRRRR